MNEKLELKSISYEWLETKRLNIKETSFLKYEWIIESQIIPFLKNNSIYSLDEEQIQLFLNNKILKENYSLSTVKTIKIVLSAILKYCERKYKTKHYDFSLIKIPTKRISAKVLTESQQKNITYYIEKNNNFISVAIRFGLYAGLRIGEICGLTWEDVDLEKGTININKIIIRLKTQNTKPKTQLVIRDPKTESSKRIVVIPDFFRLYLIELHKNVNDDKEHYIVSNDNSFIDPRTIQYHFRKVCKLYDLQINFHALRHTYATNCVKLGIDIKTISEMLGHSSVTTTLNRYVHSDLEYQRQQINKIKPTVF